MALVNFNKFSMGKKVSCNGEENKVFSKGFPTDDSKLELHKLID